MMRFLTILLVLAGAIKVYASTAYHYFDGRESLRLSPYLSILDPELDQAAESEVISGKLDEQFNYFNSEVISLPISEQNRYRSYWLKYAFDTKSIMESVFIRIDYATSPQIDAIYFRTESQPLARLIYKKNADRIRSKKYVEIPRAKGMIYLKATADDFSYPIIELEVQTASQAFYRNQDEVFLSLSYGICLALLVFNTILVLRLRDRAHVFYILYTLFLLLYYEGRYQLFAEKFSVWEIPKALLVPINAGASIFMLLFIKSMLDLRVYMPRMANFINALILLGAVTALYSFADRSMANIILMFLLILGPLVLIIASSIAAYKKLPAARLLFASILTLSLGNFLHFAGTFIGLEPGWFLRNVQLLGFDIEMLLLSIAIGHKIRVDKDQMIADINHSYAELKKIVYPHQLELIKTGARLSETMPIGRANATVIAFDIVRSSKIRIAKPQEFFSRIFSRCYKIMMENYNSERKTSNAYRIKELGDGFLCSIGYPFKLPDHTQREELAVNLGLTFISIFEEELKRIDYQHPLQCAVGIANGPIESFYPESGAQVYDLFGRSIILAARYEAMRDVIFKHTSRKENILIIQDNVFQSLSRESQQRFTCIDLEEVHFRVRDDDRARKVYYLFQSEISTNQRAS